MSHGTYPPRLTYLGLAGQHTISTNQRLCGLEPVSERRREIVERRCSSEQRALSSTGEFIGD
jgi:hypothetical protein